MLIATLPAIHQDRLLEKIIAEPQVSAVRYNTGVTSAYNAETTLEKLLELTERYHKTLWIDLKGRQLRITNWAVPNYGKILLNHMIEVDYPAKIFFRGNEWSEIKVHRGNTIYVDPPPPSAVGAGQSVNIHGKNFRITDDYLTTEDCQYIEAANRLGINRFMLSFVESPADIDSVLAKLTNREDYHFILKIESLPGLDFIKDYQLPRQQNLMAARDDLYINIGDNHAAILPALQQIIKKDPQAIVASRIFAGLENGGNALLSDWSDLLLMYRFGYKNFMLSDRICQRYFDAAINCWREFQAIER